MTARNWPVCYEHVIGSEGNFSNHPRDNGGPTKYGITHKTLADWRGVPNVTIEDVQNLTLREAKAIYKANYWNAVRGDDLPGGIDLIAFDAAVNSGPARSAKWLQAAVGVETDGVVGRVTVAAARAADPTKVIVSACGRRLDYLRSLDDADVFLKGWTNRVERVRDDALRMANRQPLPPDVEPIEPDEKLPNNRLAAWFFVVAVIVIALIAWSNMQ